MFVEISTSSKLILSSNEIIKFLISFALNYLLRWCAFRWYCFISNITYDKKHCHVEYKIL